MAWWSGRTCVHGTLLRAGAVNLSWVACQCPAAGLDDGHYVARCREVRCDPPVYPDGHVGEVPPQR